MRERIRFEIPSLLLLNSVHLWVFSDYGHYVRNLFNDENAREWKLYVSLAQAR
jgi:hypothetical protein